MQGIAQERKTQMCLCLLPWKYRWRIPLSDNNFYEATDVGSGGKKLPAKKLEKTAVPGQLRS